MRRRLAGLLLALALVPFGAGEALAIGTLDQEALPAPSPISLSAGSSLWQTFTAGLSGGLDTVSLYGSTGIGSTWNVSIQATDGSGNPTGPALVIGSASAPSSPAWTDISLSPAPSVSAGTKYAIVVAGPTPLWTQAVAYAGGAGNGLSDFAFRTYVTAGTGGTQPGPDPEFSLTKGVAATETGPFASTLTAPSGSIVWYQLVLTNRDPNGFVGLTLVDSAAGGKFPAACPAIPLPFPAGSTYTCTYSATVGTGTTTNTATAKFGPTVRTASATVTAGGTVATPSPSITPAPVPTPVASSPGDGAGGATVTPPPTDAAPRPAGGSTAPPLLPLIGLLALVWGLVVLGVRRRPASG